ncbi:uncharacterized protein LOC110107565 [Dendrobium catenatum]|uniref:Uncharacterized protein n=1 Tax=Dendrobium catenatum TaxID=906689 RepID=A0A2I0X3V7_9ASPA|nr:uncharacterized protein LOC110107565 [Dendrobium catenatum]XP_020693496.1 uncharacterized protein LOC110107565 [Dendrobium catenatum]PKU82599.1 hypothetical protein MA16_Dca019274 [Dendrobium catenatum]
MASKLTSHSNLQCFLDRTLVSVGSHSLPKTSLKDLNSLWQPIGKEEVEYFNLRDLWDQYNEWSIFGTGIPIICPNGETVLQYYVPYLSAIQIYTSESLASTRNMVEESESDSWSDDSESEKPSRSWDVTSEDSYFDQEGSWPTDRLGYLYFKYMESSPPCRRFPLMNKVNALSRRFPGLMSFKSADLSPASWMSVAWYPICYIPARCYEKDLYASFLTFHTISSAFQDDTFIDSEEDKSKISTTKDGSSKDTKNTISLPPFGLATYRMRENIWLNSENSDHEKLMTLYSAADSWLKQLRVHHHHDFKFFTAHMGKKLSFGA